MRTQLLLLVIGLSPLSAVRPAAALRTTSTYTVRFDGSVVGQWSLRNRVVDTGNTCRYTVRWTNAKVTGAPLSRTVLCRVDEYKAGDSFDCEAARRGFFETLVQNVCQCSGFDDFGQQTVINTLVAGEDISGHLNGVVSSASVGDVQNLEIH